MKKTTIIITVIILLCTFIVGSCYSSVNYSVKLGNRIIKMENLPFMNNDRIYVSVRNLCDAMGIPIYWNESKNEVHIDIYNKKTRVSDKTEYKKDGVIPDGKTALTVGKAILEKYAEKSLEYETDDKIYYIDAVYIKEINAWSVFQTFKFKYQGGWSVGDEFYCPNVTLNKNTGEVIYINTYSMFND